LFWEPKEESNTNKLFAATPQKCESGKEEKVMKDSLGSVAGAFLLATMHITFWSTHLASAPFPRALQRAPDNGVDTLELAAM
jgi:hypothetical protein